MPRIRTHTHNVVTAEFEDFEVELQYQPYSDNDVLHHVEGDKLVVAYLVHDNDGYSFDPMKNGDCQGDIYTWRSAYARAADMIITDNNSEVLSALCLDGQNEPDIDYAFVLGDPWIDYNGILQTKTTLRDLAADAFVEKVRGDFDLQRRWCEYVEAGELVEGQVYEIDLKALRRDLVDENGCFWEEVPELAHSLYSKHWRAMVGPYVVPISYHAERGSCTITTTDWDGDPDDLPDGVWVADAGAIENLNFCMPAGWTVGQIKLDNGMYSPEYELIKDGVRRHRGTLGACRDFALVLQPITPDDVINAATAYAEGIVKEYASWCEGDVYGCVVETFSLVDPGLLPVGHDDQPAQYEQTSEDSCWGFIGHEYAEQALKDDFFDPAVKAIQTTIPA